MWLNNWERPLEGESVFSSNPSECRISRTASCTPAAAGWLPFAFQWRQPMTGLVPLARHLYEGADPRFGDGFAIVANWQLFGQRQDDLSAFDDATCVGLRSLGDVATIVLPSRPTTCASEFLFLHFDQRFTALHEGLPPPLSDYLVEACELGLLLRGDLSQFLPFRVLFLCL